MKTVSKKVLSVFIALVISLTAVVPSFAVSEITWESLWESEYDNAVMLSPGSNDSEMGISWYYTEISEPKVIISKDATLDDAKTFNGECIETYDGDFANKVTVTGLEAGETYYYQCISGDFESEVYSFGTAENPNEFTALYMTDIHITAVENDLPSEAELERTAEIFNGVLNEAYTRFNPSILLSAGDQGSYGLQSEYKGLSSALALKSIPIATTVGNHDQKGVAYKTFGIKPNEKKDFIVSSYIGNDYWFTRGDVLFLVVNSNNASGTDHRIFVRDAIKANPDAKWKVMMAHHDLYSGRLPRRESENALLRLLWTPIADEFGIDLVLLGHSHYYTVSNVIYNQKTVQPYAETMTDPEGTIYMVSGSITRPRGEDDELGLNEDWIGAYNTPDERKIYNVLDFTEDSITVSSYYTGEENAFNEYTIVKTDKDGGHPDKMTALYNPVIRFIGTIVAFFSNFGVYDDITNRYNFDVNFFDVVF